MPSRDIPRSRLIVNSCGYSSRVITDDPTTRQTNVGDNDARDDVETDPALDTEGGSDWTDEGGATTEGASTDTKD